MSNAAATDSQLAVLPPQFREIAGLVGVGPALSLVAAQRGERIYVPAADNVRAEHWLAALLGLDGAMALAYAYGPGPLDVPTLAGATYARAVAETERLTALGRSANEIARAMGITRRTIYNHRRAGRGQRLADLPLLDGLDWPE